MPHGDWVYVWALGVGITVWIIPAWKRRRLAAAHNGDVLEREMEQWRCATLCLECGNVGSSPRQT
jgi:hypothetical protein